MDSGLVSRYSAVASDGAGAKDAREAAMLLAVAEGHVDNEEEEAALTAAQDALKFFRSKSDHAGMADALSIVIKCYAIQGRDDEASSLSRDELANFRKAKKKAQEGKMLLSLSQALANQPKLKAEALGYSKDALALFKEDKQEKMEAAAKLSAAQILCSMGKKDAAALKEADGTANDALAIYKKLGDQKGEAAAIHAVADVKAASGDVDEAIDMAEDALSVLQDIRQHKLEAFEMNAIAGWYLKRGKAFKALQFAEDALEIIRELGASKKKEVDTLNSIVQGYIAKGMTGKAVKVASNGLTRFQEAGDTRAEAETQRVLYAAYVANGNLEQASLCLEKAVEAAADSGDKELESQLLCESADSHLKAGRADWAVEKASRALELAQDGKDYDGINNALQCAVNAMLAQDDGERDAVEKAKEVRDMMEASGNPQAEATTCLILSQAHNAAGSTELAAAAAKAATEIAYQQDDEVLEANALDQLTAIHMDSGKYEKAARAAEQSRRIWKTRDDAPRECKALDQVANAQVHQGYKRQSSTKSTGSVGAIFEKATKAANECIVVAEGLPASENGKAFIASSHRVISQVHAALGEHEESYDAAKTAADLYKEIGDDRGGAYASVLMSQADMQEKKWDKALKAANEAMKGFKKHKDESGQQFAQTLIDKIQKSMPKPEPVFAPQMMMMMSGAPRPGGGQPNFQMMQDMGGGGGGAIERTGNALDMANLSEEIVIVKIKEVALAIIGEDEDEVELDTPLMEAGMTSSTAVIFRDELMKDLPGVNLPPTLIFDYPSVNGIAEFVMEKVG